MPEAEVSEIRTQLFRVTLEAEQSRAYWRHGEPSRSVEAETEAAFTQYWFGSKSMPRVHELINTFRRRFAAYPEALTALHAWDDIDAASRILVCHWHLQLTDPVYRRFSGDYLPKRRRGGRDSITREAVLTWISDFDAEGRWSAATRVGFASKLLSAAHASGLVTSKRDPRPLATPRVPTQALAYLLYLLRSVAFEGSLHDNPYLRSVGLDGGLLDDRFRSVPGVDMGRVGDIVDFTWAYLTLPDWSAHTVGASPPASRSAS
ncbi:MAG: hypothetical protein V3V08_09205 [Nannocystaceae bacterium]